MKISMPQKDGHHNDSIEYFAELRDLSQIRDDLWQLKITIPAITIYDNLWMSFNDEEIDFLLQEINRYRKVADIPSNNGKEKN